MSGFLKFKYFLQKKAGGAILALSVDGEGNTKYDQIANQGRKDKNVFSKFTDLIERNPDGVDIILSLAFQHHTLAILLLY